MKTTPRVAKRDANGLTANDRRRLENALGTLADYEGTIGRQFHNGASAVRDVCDALRRLAESRSR